MTPGFGKLWVLCFLWLALLMPATAAAQTLVVNGQVDHDHLKLSTVRAIFAMRMRRWPDGSAIRVYVLAADSNSHQAFCKTVLDVYPHQLTRAWNRLVYSGTGQAPIVVADEAEMREKLATTPGAVGYLSEYAGAGSGVRVVEVR